MSMIVAHNMSAINTKRQFGTSARGMASAMEKLSSGYKINAGKDDPSGLVISEKLRSQISGLQRAQQNTEEAINVMGIAEGALNEMNSILKKMKALAIHSSNTGVTSPDQIAADQAEMDSSIQTLDRIAKNTNFSGDKLLNGAKDIVFDQDTLTKGTQQNSLLDANASSFSQIFKRDAFSVSINYTGSTDATARTGTGTVDFSQQAMKAYFEVDTSSDPENRAQVKDGVFTQAQQFTLTGNKGTRAFTFKQGDSVADMVNQIKSAADTTGIDAALVFNSEQEIAKLQNGGGGENAVQATYDVGLKDKDGEAIQVTMTAPVDNEMVDDLEIKIGAKVNADGELDGYTLTMVDRFGEDKTVDWDGKKTVDLGKLFGDEQYNGIKLNGLSKDADPGQTISDLYTAETVSQTKDEYAGIGSGEMRLDFNPTDTEATNLKNAGVSSVDVTASGSSQAPDFTVALKDANGDVIKEAKLTSDQLLALSDDPDSGVTYDDLTGFNVDDLGKAMASLATTDEEKAQAQKDFGGISFGVDGFVGTPNAARMEPVTLSTGKISYQVSEDADLTLATLKVKSDHFEVEGASSTPKPAKPGYVEFSFGDEVGVDGRFSSRDAEAQEALRKAMAAYGSTADLNFQIGLADGATPDNMSYKLTAKIGTAEIVLAEDWDGKSDIDMSEIPPLDVSAEPKAQNLRDALANMGTLQFAGEVDGAAFGDTTMTNIKDNSGPVKLTNSLYGRDSGSITVGLGSDALENLHNTLKNATGAGAEETLAAFEKALQEGTLRIEYSTTGTQTHTDYDLELRLTDGTNVFDRTTITHAALGLNANGVTSTAGTTINAGASVFDGANIKIDDVKNRYDNGVTGAINNDSGSGIVSGVNLSRTIDSTTVTIEAPDLDNVTRTGGEYTKSTGYGDGPGGIEFTFDGLFDEDGNAVTFTSTSDTEELRARLTDTLVNAGFGAEDFELALRVEETADGSGTAASPKYDVFLDLSFNSGASSAIYKLTEGWDGKENTFTTSNIGLVDSYNLGSATVGVINNFVNELASFSFEVSGDISAAKSGFLGEPSFADINDLSIATNIYTSLAGNGGDLEMTLVEDDLKAIFAALVDDETRAKFMEEIAAGEITVDYSIQSKNGILEPNHTNGYAVNIALRSANTGNLYGTIVSTIDSVNADGSGASAATVFRSSATGAADVSLTNDALAATANTNENATGLDSASMVGVGTANLANAGAAQDFGTPATAPSSNTLVGATGINGYQDTDENDVVAASFTVANTNGNGTFTNTAGTDLDVTFTATNSSLDINYALQEALKAMDPDATIAFSFNGGGTTDRIANTVTATVTTGAGTYDLNIGEWDGVSPIDLSKISIAGNYTETNTALLNDVVDALKDLGSLEVTATNAGAPAVIDHGDTFGTNPELTVPTATSTTVLDNLYSANSGTVGLSLDEQAWKDIYAALVADVGSAGGADRLKAFEEAARGINNQNLAFKVAVTGGPADHGNYGLTITLTNGLTGSDEVELGTITLTHDQLGLNDSGVTQGAGTSLRNLNFDTIGGNTSQAFTGDGARLSVTDRQGGYRDNIVGDVNSQTGSYDYKNVNADITFNDPDTTHDGAAQFPVEDLLPDTDGYKSNKSVYLNGDNITGGVSTAESAGSSVRNKGDIAVFNNTTEKGTGKVTQGVAGVNVSQAGAESILYGGNTDGQGRIFVKFLDDNKFELYKDSSMAAESKVASGISGQEITEYNNSGLTGLTLDLTGTELAGKKGVYLSFAGIEGQSGIRYDGDVVNTAKSVVDKDGKAVLDDNGNPVTTFDGAARFDADRTLVTGVELGTNTSSDGVIYLQNNYVIDDQGNATIQVSAYKDKNMRSADLVAQSQVYQVGKFKLDDDGKLMKDDDGNLIPDESFDATSITVVLNEKRNSDDTEGTGLGMVMSIDTAAFKGQTKSTTLEGNMTFTNLGARIYSQDYGSDAYVKITQSKGAIFNYYDRAGDASSKRLVDAGKNGTTYQMNGQDASLSVNGMMVRTSGLRLKMANQDIQADFTFNQGKVGSTTIAQVGYDIGSIFTRIGALNYGSAEDDEEGMSGLLCNAGHVTQERIGNFQGGMQLQLGDSAGDQDRTVVAMKSLTSDNLGKVTRSGAWDVGSSVITERTFTMQDVAGGGMAELKSDPILAMAIIDQAISDVTEMRATIGAFQSNLLQTNSNNLSVTIENVTKTESGIRDADMADEMAEFTKQQVLQNAAMSMLGQANQASQNVLQLLR